MRLDNIPSGTIITSPPYMRSLTYARDNRLRLWFLGLEDWKILDSKISPICKNFVQLMQLSIKKHVQSLSIGKKRVLIIAEGFETRSLSWIKSQPNRKLFEQASSALLINAKNDREPWREEAAIQINQRVMNDFRIYRTAINSFDLMDYISVFEFMAEIYRNNCYSRRIIVSPTGGKIHTLSCALIKACCQDIHIEYPTPESYHFDDYSSDEVNAIHEIYFPHFNYLLKEITQKFGLNG